MAEIFSAGIPCDNGRCRGKVNILKTPDSLWRHLLCPRCAAAYFKNPERYHRKGLR